jgi:hypothetical protein
MAVDVVLNAMVGGVDCKMMRKWKGWSCFTRQQTSLNYKIVVIFVTPSSESLLFFSIRLLYTWAAVVLLECHYHIPYQDCICG